MYVPDILGYTAACVLRLIQQYQARRNPLRISESSSEGKETKGRGPEAEDRDEEIKRRRQGGRFLDESR